jgi:pimeloyl-ACP methyl ester carboxylesterase
VFYSTQSDTTRHSVRSVYRYSPIHDESFHWLEAGPEDGRTVVLIHGFMAHGMAYRRVLDALADTFRVVVPDLPAHGRDRTFQSPHLGPEIYDLIEWFDCLLEAVAPDEESVDVVGHSLGALLSFVAAREQPRFRAIDRVVLVSPGIRIGVPTWTSQVIEMLPRPLASLGTNRLGMRLYEPIQWRQSRMDGDEMTDYLRPLKDPDRLDFILSLGADMVSEPDRLPGAHRVSVPTLLITGDKDHLVSLDAVELLDSVIPDSEMSVFEGVGHCPMEDAPADFTSSVRGFLAN